MDYIQSIKGGSAAILTRYIMSVKPSAILEIGTGEGASGILMLSAAPDFCCLTTIEKDQQSAKKAEENFLAAGVESRARVINGDAKEVLPALSGSFDFIFLDGPKGQYINYLPSLVRLLNSGGVLAADNILFRGMVESPLNPPREYRTIVNNLRRFRNAISTDERLETILFYTDDGLSISIKR